MTEMRAGKERRNRSYLRYIIADEKLYSAFQRDFERVPAITTTLLFYPLQVKQTRSTTTFGNKFATASVEIRVVSSSTVAVYMDFIIKISKVT